MLTGGCFVAVFAIASLRRFVRRAPVIAHVAAKRSAVRVLPMPKSNPVHLVGRKVRITSHVLKPRPAGASASAVCAAQRLAVCRARIYTASHWAVSTAIRVCRLPCTSSLAPKHRGITLVVTHRNLRNSPRRMIWYRDRSVFCCWQNCARHGRMTLARMTFLSLEFSEYIPTYLACYGGEKCCKNCFKDALHLVI